MCVIKRSFILMKTSFRRVTVFNLVFISADNSSSVTFCPMIAWLLIKIWLTHYKLSKEFKYNLNWKVFTLSSLNFFECFNWISATRLAEQIQFWQDPKFRRHISFWRNLSIFHISNLHTYIYLQKYFLKVECVETGNKTRNTFW